MSLADILGWTPGKIPLLEIKMPLREDICAAAPICEAFGNYGESCQAGGATGLDSRRCLATLILLFSRQFGLWPQEFVEALEKRRIGFDLSSK